MCLCNLYCWKLHSLSLVLLCLTGLLQSKPWGSSTWQWETSQDWGLKCVPSVSLCSCSTTAPPGLPHALLEGHAGLLLQHHGIGSPIREVHERRWRLCDTSCMFFFLLFSFPCITPAIWVCLLFWSYLRSSSWTWRTSCELPPTSPAALKSGRQQKWSWTTGNQGQGP